MLRRYCYIVTLLVGIVVMSTSASGKSLETALCLVAEPENKTMLFTDNEPVVFKLNKSVAGEIHYKLVDHYERQIASGKCENGRIRLAKLPRGYYRLTLETSDNKFNGYRGFGVLSSRPGQNVSGSLPYCVDSGLFHDYPFCFKDRLEGPRRLAEIAEQIGVGTVRIRFFWGVAEPRPGVYDPTPTRRVAEQFHKRGMKLSVAFHDAPAWTKRNKKDKLPSDLLSVYRMAKTMAAALPEITIWEIWNEQDSLPGWEYAAVEKAAYWGVKDGNPLAKVTPGSCILFSLPNEVQQQFMNGVGEYCDFFNYHNYAPFKKYPARAAEVRQLLKRYGVGHLSTIVTEMGTYADGKKGKAKSLFTGKPCPDYKQQMVLAEFIPKSQILEQREGVSQSFSFNLRIHQEGEKQWGITNGDVTARPGAVALATLINELGGKKYLGELTLSPSTRAFLYEDGKGKQTLAIWKISDLDHIGDHGVLPDSSQRFNSESVMMLKSDGRLKVGGGGPTIRIGPQNLKKIQVVDVLGMPVKATLKNGTLQFPVNNCVSYIHGLSRLKAKNTVPSALPDKHFSRNWDKRTILQIFAGKEPGKAEITFWNLSDKEKRGKLKSPVVLEGIPSLIVLPPMSKKTYQITARRPEKFTQYVKMFGIFNGKKTSPLVFPYAKIFRVFKEVAVPGIDLTNPKYWTRNCSGKIELTYDKLEKALLVSSSYKPGQAHWCFPGVHFNKTPIDLTGVYGFRFDMKTDTIRKPYPRNYLYWINGKRSPLLPSPDRWVTCDAIFMESPDKIKYIEIGVSAIHNTMTYRLKNFRLLK